MNVSRRTLTKGAAWSVPAVAVASAAPAMAASLLTCSIANPPTNNYVYSGGGTPPTTPTWGNSSRLKWGDAVADNACTRNNTPGCAGYGYGFSSNKDNQSASGQWVLAYAPVSVVSGHTYTWTFSIYAGYGNQLTTSQPQTVELRYSTTSTGTGTMFTGGTFTAASNSLVPGAVNTTNAQFTTRATYPTNPTNYNLLSVSTSTTSDTYCWGIDYADTYKVSYTATFTGTLYLQYYFYLPPDNGLASDDILVSVPTMTCV